MATLSGNEVLAVDAGTQGLSAALVNSITGQILAVGDANYPASNTPEAAARGHIEHRAEWWISALAQAMENLRARVQDTCGEKIEKVSAIGVTGHMHCMVRSDAEGHTPWGCDMWNDGRATKEAAILSAEFGESIPERWTAAHMLWRALNESSEWRQCQHVTVPSGHIVRMLSGAHVIGPGDASGMFGVLDENGQINVQKLHAMQLLTQNVHGRQLTDMVPRVVPAGQVAARLNETGSKLLGGLPIGIPIAAPEGDQQSALVASGAQPQELALSAGTSFTGNVPSERGFVPENERVNVLASPDLLKMLMVCVRNGTVGFADYVTGLSRLSRRKFPEVADELTLAALAVPADCHGALPLPFYMGENVIDRSHVRGAIVNMGAEVLSNPGVMARLLLEGPCHTLRYGLEFLESKVGKVTAILLSGGALHSKNGFAPQLFADVIGIPVRARIGDEEGTAKGAAYLAAYVAHRENGGDLSLPDFVQTLLAGEVRTWKPNPQLRDLYDRRYGAIKGMIETVVDTVASLSS